MVRFQTVISVGPLLAPVPLLDEVGEARDSGLLYDDGRWTPKYIYTYFVGADN